MSQVFWSSTLKMSGREVEVMAGWDAPMDEFFATVFLKDPEEDEEEATWSTIAKYLPGDPALRDTTALKSTLGKMLLPAPPDDFWKMVERKEGNVMYHALPEGGWRRSTIR